MRLRCTVLSNDNVTEAFILAAGLSLVTLVTRVTLIETARDWPMEQQVQFWAALRRAIAIRRGGAWPQGYQLLPGLEPIDLCRAFVAMKEMPKIM